MEPNRFQGPRPLTGPQKVTFCTNRRLPILALAAVLALAGATRAQAEAQLLIEAATGKVLHAENATYPWYPASVTKLMTAYTTLRAIKEGRLSFNTLAHGVEERGGAAADQDGLQGRHHGHRR